MTDHEDLARRYPAQWNEPDAEARRTLIRALWAVDGAPVLVDPPQTMRDSASALAFPTPPLEVRGHDALERRVRRAYEMFVEPGHLFVARGPVARLSANLLGVGWGMVDLAGVTIGGGYDVLAVDGEGRIRLDHQYIGIDATRDSAA